MTASFLGIDIDSVHNLIIVHYELKFKEQQYRRYILKIKRCT